MGEMSSFPIRNSIKMMGEGSGVFKIRDGSWNDLLRLREERLGLAVGSYVTPRQVKIGFV